MLWVSIFPLPADIHNQKLQPEVLYLLYPCGGKPIRPEALNKVDLHEVLTLLLCHLVATCVSQSLMKETMTWFK